MTVEDKYLLREPGYGDTADIGDINHNTDLIANGMYQNRLMIGKAYNPDREEPYMKGDLVVKQTTVLEDGKPVAYNFEYYKALEDNITGVWDASKWELTDISTELATKGGADVTKTASGNPIEITDGANAPLVKCVTAIQGNQDLHGYDKPWVGGAGKNKFTIKRTGRTNNGITYTPDESTIKAVGTATNLSYAFSDSGFSYSNSTLLPSGTYTVSMNQITGSAFSVSKISESGGIESTIVSYTNNASATFTLEEDTYIAVRIRIDEGTVVDHVFTIQIEESSTPTAYEPYSNICPITAYDESTISVDDNNAIDTSKHDTSNGYRVGYYLASNGNETESGAWYISEYFRIGADTVYRVTSASGNNPGICFYDINKNYITGEAYTNRSYFDITTPSNAVYARMSFYSQNENTLAIKRVDGYSSTAQFSQSIYQGNADFVGGSVRADYLIHTIELSELTGVYSLGTVWRIGTQYFRDAIKSCLSSEVTTAISSKFNAVSEDGRGQFYTFYQSNPSNILYFDIPKSDSATEDDAKAIIVGSQIAYELATPTTETITPTNLPLKSLFGYNHIESSTGDMEIEYITEEYQPIVDLIESNKHIYSTAEQIVGTWIDGSTIYEKTIYDAGGQSGAVTFAHGISNFGKLISIEGNCYDNQENAYMPFPRVGPDGNNIGIVSVDSTNVQYAVAGAFSTRVVDVYLTIRYTKTTPTRSLNLTKSAVTEEIPDEIKNAEYEEKPDVNEADDDAPTEEQER